MTPKQRSKAVGIANALVESGIPDWRAVELANAQATNRPSTGSTRRRDKRPQRRNPPSNHRERPKPREIEPRENSGLVVKR